MGRKNNNKKKATRVASGGGSNSFSPVRAFSNNNDINNGDELSFIRKENRQQLSSGTCNEPTLFPPKPNMFLDPNRMRNKLYNSSPKNRSATATRLIQADQMLIEIEKIQKERGKDYYDDNLVDISLLKSDSSYIRECVLWIKAYVSTDFRVPCPSDLLIGSPLPECWTHITSLHPLSDNRPQLMRVDAFSFVILLAAAIRLGQPQERFSLQIVHELHAHAEGKYDWLDFDDLKSHDELRELDEAYLRFALAWTGIKRARAMYRNEGQRVAMPQFQSRDDAATQSKSLLQSIETFAKEQCHYCPESPVGLWNMGYVSSQVKHNGRHPWRSLVDFYNQMCDCCLLADKADDDFYRAEAGIEAAMALVLGGKPNIGYPLKSGEKVQVLRDFGRASLDDYEEGEQIGFPIGGPTPAAAREAMNKEMRRLRDKVPPETLQEGETVIVPHWEVARIWNYAMKAYLRLEAIGQGQCVYGESTGWDIAENFLAGKFGALEPNRYINCPQVGFRVTRDKGTWPCGHCGKYESNLLQCSRCKSVHYCNRECQKKAWKTHKLECKAA
eukprot:scaffold4586_cov152-Skeletonema_menzelii.AAC.5